MIEDIKLGLIQLQLQKITSSITISPHINKLDMKGLKFLFYAEYDIIYQSFEMKNAVYLEKKIANKSKRQQNQQIKRKFQVLSDKNHDKILKHDSKIDRNLHRLQFLWEEKNIQYFHRFYFEKNIDNNLRNYVECLESLIANEQKLIKFDHHIIYSLNKAVHARQKCLLEIKALLHNLKDKDIQEYLGKCQQRVLYIQAKKDKIAYQIQGYKINKIVDHKISQQVFQLSNLEIFGQHINNLIKLSVHIISLFAKWKQYLYSLTPDLMKKKESIDYYLDQENYILRMLNDNSFVQKSFLCKYYKFSPKNDPFFLQPLLQIEAQQKSEHNDLNSQNNQRQISISMQRKYLKRIFSPKSQHQAVEIMSKLRILLGQYQKNIKSRKIYDLKLIHSINNFQLSLEPNFSKNKSSSKNFVKTLSKSNQTSKMINTSIDEMLASRLTIRNTNMSSSLKKLQTLQNPQQKRTTKQFFKTSKFLNSSQLLSIKSQLKQKIKSQFQLSKRSNKIFELPEFANYIETQARLFFSQNKFNKKLFNEGKGFEKLYVETYSIEENELSATIGHLYQKESLLKYEFMQVSKQQLLGKSGDSMGLNKQGLQNFSSIYFLKIKHRPQPQNADSSSQRSCETVSTLIFTVKYVQNQQGFSSTEVKYEKLIQVLYMTIKYDDLHILQRVILKAVQFLFKFETSEIISFRFYYRPDLEGQRKKAEELKEMVKMNCWVGEKDIFPKDKIQNDLFSQSFIKSSSNGKKGQNFQKIQNFKTVEMKLIFSRKQQLRATQIGARFLSKSTTFSPFAINLVLRGVFVTKGLNLISTQNERKESVLVNYDYLRTEVIQNHLNSDLFMKLKNSGQQQKLKVILENISQLKQYSKMSQSLPFIETFSSTNIVQLNKLLTSQNKIVLKDLEDLTPSNTIKMFNIQLKLSLPYKTKMFLNIKGQGYFRFEIARQIQVRNLVLKSEFASDSEANIIPLYCLPVLQKKNLLIFLFDGSQICKFIIDQNNKLKAKGINRIIGLEDIINVNSFSNTGESAYLKSIQKRYIRNLYMPMISNKYRLPFESFVECPYINFGSYQSDRFYIQQRFEWGGQLLLQSGVRYKGQKDESDILFQKGIKMGIGMIGPSNVIIYSKINE